jgi:hypothetical protein
MSAAESGRLYMVPGGMQNVVWTNVYSVPEGRRMTGSVQPLHANRISPAVH